VVILDAISNGCVDAPYYQKQPAFIYRLISLCFGKHGLHIWVEHLMQNRLVSNLQSLLAQRFSDAPSVPPINQGLSTLDAMAGRGSTRSFQDKAVSTQLLETLCAIALAAPSKSDLQQRDIILMTSPQPRAALASLVSGQDWVANAPIIAVFCGNNRRQRQLHDWHDVTFANDHLDAFFNAAVDAAIALGAFVTAAEAVGLGCCPISAIRNKPEAVSKLLDLPDHVFPVAGLAIGYPAHPAPISKRLPLALTTHHDRFTEDGIEQAVQDYDTQRENAQPYQDQRFSELFGESESYGWSEDKVRQYSQPERKGFGDFIKAKGFRLE
jgi:FMN reductase [NAD(P)H]